MWRAARKNNSEKTHQSCRGWWNMRGTSCLGVRRVATVGRHEKDCMARNQHKCLCHSGRRCWGPISSEPLNRLNPRFKLGAWLGVRNSSAECFVGAAQGVFRAGEVRRIEQRDRWDKEAVNNVIGVPWRMVDGKWIVDSPVTQVDPLPPPPVPFEGAPGPTSKASEPLQDARVAMRSELESEHKLTQTPAEPGLRSVSRQLQKVQSVLGRRSEVFVERGTRKRSCLKTSEEERKLDVEQERCHHHSS